MATISSPGLGSGLDINGIITKLMAVESQPLTALATKEASYQAKLSALGSLKGALSSLQTAAQTLKNASTFTTKSASSSDSSVFTASASSTAAAGIYEIAVNKLALAERLKSDADYTSTTFGSGTLNITVGTTTKEVTLSGTSNTLANIRDAINSANVGVTATIIKDTRDHLVITSNTVGLSGNISITGTGAVTSLATDLDAHVYQAAQDAEFVLNGDDLNPVTRSSNTISDVIDGVTFYLLKADETNPPTATLTVAKNNGTVTAAITAFVKAYNDAIGSIKQMTTYDASNKKASVLTGDSTVRSIQSQLSSLVSASVSGITGGISRLSDIGITVQKDGTLAVDSSKLSAAIADPDKDVAALFTQTTSRNEGIAVRFNTMLEGIVGLSGLITNRTDGINSSIKDLQRRAEALNQRLTAVEARYRAQFSRLDTLIASMNQTSTYLTQQLANLPGTSSNS